MSSYAILLHACENIEKLCKDYELPAGRIRVFPYGVSSESDTVMLERFEETNGSGSKIVTGKERDDLNRIRTITIDDFIQIPKLIKNILPDYRLFLRQHAESWCDTVLYAM